MQVFRKEKFLSIYLQYCFFLIATVCGGRKKSENVTLPSPNGGRAGVGGDLKLPDCKEKKSSAEPSLGRLGSRGLALLLLGSQLRLI